MSLGWARRLPSVRVLVALYVVAGVVAGLVSLAAESSQNLEVFRDASLALLRGEDLYVLRSADYYKYSPTFAFGFLPFAWMPVTLAAAAWPALNFGIAAWGMVRIVAAVWKEADADTRSRTTRALLALSLPGILLTTDGDQSNLLVAGMCLGAVAFYIEERPVPAAPLLAFAVLVKIFPIALGAVALVVKDKVKALVALAVSALVLALAPILVVGPSGLAMEYRSWWALVVRDRGPTQAPWSNWSVMHAFDALGLSGASLWIQLVGASIFGICALIFIVAAERNRRAGRVIERNRLCFAFAVATFAFVLAFNHRSESPTYVLSAIAVAMYVLMHDPTGPWRWSLLVLVTLSVSPIYSDYKAHDFTSVLSAKRLFHPLRMVPIVLLWLVVEFEIVSAFMKHGREKRLED